MGELLFYIQNNKLFFVVLIIFALIYFASKSGYPKQVINKFSAKVIGEAGEMWTQQILNKLPRDKYIVMHDVFISVNGTTHQIDHVVISPYGIFSIETKQYNGYITGNKYDKKWVRHSGRKKYYYTNPIRQNYGHVKALAELLNLEESKIYNVVCIPSKATLNIQHDGELTRYSTLYDKIISYNEEIIDNVFDLYEFISNNNIKDSSKRKEHVDIIKKNLENLSINCCPKCGANLVKRNGRNGLFIGCSNYPNCKYTRNI